ncbi:hypothetical protein A3D05_05245 [Candidatus Gottesmanbacteria bacterium RIFCSPHIGHO2_02_FULL_40_24]|uniref:BioF2-like acetyltransferase domain-containing protein n=1 Tax=Candidatus Gottesmanbacteria bacterium RIFCSPHIGHO2_01_FULL_40_15 TaxID=1798376 RepID=A0A1F5Z6W6_9BACT|nr:MAG: hypothetical protein A2777_01880 [Candidatus Gottesmanbacteria bacterium RIFCSPHIGHO2_01_FULL_40_15]OGG16437.1 MAG: hypothetical protein A3D05_05245 [Candidatus Gottesmanbacteria bacterium RIFCSPHIGHO2_02_FULL_40_24]OGG25551.1 MAG: hypothetical protein A3E42_04395 [Candidatus Gottesmanbacteria bacterium RIFCSPHIGHO2_12_FULL_40_13]
MIATVFKEKKEGFNRLASHPLQSWEWGEFRLKTGIEVLRLGLFSKNKLVETAQISLHQIPFTGYRIGYFPKGNFPSKEMLDEFMKIGASENLIFIKIEPNIEKKNLVISDLKKDFPVKESPHPLFTRYTFRLNMNRSEDELLSVMHHKTRYNIKLAEKKGVYVVEDNSDEAFNKYLALLDETTVRQKFYAHTPKYHRLMWETLKPAKIARLLLAKYKDQGGEKTLVAWVLFLFNNVMYYPYGASSAEFRNLMPSNLIMWKAITYAKKHKAETFDMWGALGPNPDPNDPWYGFHKFKEGFGADLTELAGSYDLVINKKAYLSYNLLHNFRELYLKMKR